MSGTDCGVLAGGCSVTDTVLLLRPEHAGAPFAASPQTYLRLRVPVCRWVRNPRLCLALQAPHSCRQPYPTPLPPSSEGHCHGIASPALPVPKLCHHSGLQAQGLAALLAMDSRPALPPLWLAGTRARCSAGHGQPPSTATTGQAAGSRPRRTWQSDWCERGPWGLVQHHGAPTYLHFTPFTRMQLDFLDQCSQGMTHSFACAAQHRQTPMRNWRAWKWWAASRSCNRYSHSQLASRYMQGRCRLRPAAGMKLGECGAVASGRTCSTGPCMRTWQEQHDGSNRWVHVAHANRIEDRTESG